MNPNTNEMTNGLPRFLERIRNAVLAATGLTFEQYTAKSQCYDVYFARMLFAFQAKKLLSEREIGRLLKRHRTTIISSLKKYNEEVEYNPRFKQLSEIVEEDVGNDEVIKQILNTMTMTEKEALNLLHTFQKWRRGANMEMPTPTQVGIALDVAIRTMRRVAKRNY